jgi:hypothetical protein
MMYIYQQDSANGDHEPHALKALPFNGKTKHRRGSELVAIVVRKCKKLHNGPVKTLVSGKSN